MNEELKLEKMNFEEKEKSDDSSCTANSQGETSIKIVINSEHLDDDSANDRLV